MVALEESTESIKKDFSPTEAPEEVLRVENLRKWYPLKRGFLETVFSRDELNVKAFEVRDDAKGLVRETVKPELKALGPKLGKDLPRIRQALAEGRYERRDGQVAQVVAVPEHDQLLVFEVCDADQPAVAGRRDVRGRDDDEVFLQQLLGGQRRRRGRQREHDQRQVQRAARQVPDEVVRTALLDQQLDAGIAAVVGTQDVWKQSCT